MYDLVDRPVTSLDHGARFLVWSMRAWVKSMHDSPCPCTAIGPAFAKWKMIAGLPNFHKMMLIFNRNALETFRFCALECNRVSEHEALILSFVHGMRMSRPEVVWETMALVVEEDAVTDLVGAILALGRSMSESSIFPGPPDAERHCQSRSVDER
ncbi:MAG: hypothetical protein WBO17_03295 [Sphingorhabdus sp.]